MKVSFELTIEDIVNFNVFHSFGTSKHIKKNIRQAKVMVLAVFLLASVFLLISVNDIYLSILPAVFGIVFYAVYPKTIKNALRKNVRNMCREGKTFGMIGPMELEIREDVLFSRSEAGESTRVWRGINQVAETDDYLYIYISPISAHIIPKKAVTEGDAKEFFEQVKIKLGTDT